MVPADRVRNATSSLVEFFCLLCTVFVAACTVCSAATVFSLLRRRSAAPPSDRPEQLPQPPLCIALAAGDVVVALNKVDEVPIRSVVFNADTVPRAVYPVRPFTSSEDDACPGKRRRLFVPHLSPTLASVPEVVMPSWKLVTRHTSPPVVSPLVPLALSQRWSSGKNTEDLEKPRVFEDRGRPGASREEESKLHR